MSFPSISPIIASISELIIWVVLAIGWVIIQAAVKNSVKKGRGEQHPASSPRPGLDDFLKQIVGHAGEAADAAKQHQAAPVRRDAAPMQAGHPNRKRTVKVRTGATAHSQIQSSPERPLIDKPVTPTEEAGAKTFSVQAKAHRVASFFGSLNTPRDWRRAVLLREVMGPPKALSGIERDLPGAAGQ